MFGSTGVRLVGKVVPTGLLVSQTQYLRPTETTRKIVECSGM
jgi:hypothetical protein